MGFWSNEKRGLKLKYTRRPNTNKVRVANNYLMQIAPWLHVVKSLIHKFARQFAMFGVEHVDQRLAYKRLILNLLKTSRACYSILVNAFNSGTKSVSKMQAGKNFQPGKTQGILTQNLDFNLNIKEWWLYLLFKSLVSCLPMSYLLPSLRHLLAKPIAVHVCICPGLSDHWV